MERIISKQEAIKAKLIHYYTGKPCKNGHLTKRFVKSGKCTMCRTLEGQTSEYKTYKAKWRLTNKKDILDKERVRYQENKDRILQRAKDYYNLNKKEIAEYKKQYAKNVYNERLRTTGRGKYNTMLYHTSRLQRCPVWANLKLIQEIYLNCPEDCEVDHILPLRGKLISGLHVENNLQYVTKSENASKNNKFIPYIETK